MLLLALLVAPDRDAPLKPLPPCPSPTIASPFLTDPAPGDDRYPIPHNPALGKKRLAERVAWLHGQIVGDFDRLADPKADVFKAAWAAVVATAALLARRDHRSSAEIEARDKSFLAARHADAKLPVYGLWLRIKNVEKLGTIPAITDELSPFNRLQATLLLIPGDPADLEPFRSAYRPALATLAHDPHPEAAYHLAWIIAKLGLSGGPAGETAEAMAARPAEELKLCGASVAVRDRVLGNFWFEQGWAARGTKPVSQVPPEAVRLFRTRLERAEGLLVAAHDADPADPAAAALMLNVCKALGRSRSEMEGWFRKALEADPDNADAITAKADYLTPRWGGSVVELTAFARQCVRVGNHDSLFASVMLKAHQVATAARSETDLLGDPLAYADLLAAYEPVARHRPADRSDRSQLVRLLDMAAHVQAAWAHADALNEQLWVGPGDDPLEADRLVKVIKRRAALLK